MCIRDRVQLSCINIISSALNIARVLQLEKKDKGMNIMPLFHIHGLIASLLSSIVTGSSVVCTSGFNALTFYAKIKNFKPTWITAVPTMYQAILSRASRNKEIIETSKLRFSTRHFPSYEKVRFFTLMLIFIWLIYVIFVYNASVFSTELNLN